MSIQLHPNILMKLMKFSEIDKFQFIPPDCQRILNQHRVDELYNNIKIITNDFEKQYNPVGCVTISETLDDSKIHIIDGQHRLSTFNRIFLESKMDISFFCQWIKVENKAENEKLFKHINDSLPLSILPEGVKRLPISQVVKFMRDKYPSFFSNTKGKRRPLINSDCVEEHLAKVLILLKKDSISTEEFMYLLDKHNNVLKDKNRHYFTTYGRDVDKFYKKCVDSGGLFVGLITDYSWIYDMFNIPKPKEEEKEDEISLNNNAYRNVIYERDEHKCKVCKKATTREEFHMGHIISKYNGGSDQSDNICLLCPSCNMSIGKKNIPDFCKSCNIIWI